MMSLSPSGTEVLMGVGILVLGITALVFLLRYQLTKGRVNLPASRTKHAGKDIFALRAPLHRLALCVALGLSILAINWTQRPDDRLAEFSVEYDTDDDFFEVIPPTLNEPPPPPPAPPPIIEATPEPLEEAVTFVDQTLDDQDMVVAPEPALKEPIVATPPPPPLPPPPKVDNTPLLFVERMPVFGLDCQELATEAERKTCSDQALLKFLSKQVKYPAFARENNIEGRVTLQFTVERDGSITDIKVARGVGAGLDKESIRVIELIDQLTEGFTPGKQQGEPVRVRFTVPIQFKLQ
ncbi:MAG: energy transducer TonB [Bacteroidota bacterium]